MLSGRSITSNAADETTQRESVFLVPTEWAADKSYQKAQSSTGLADVTATLAVRSRVGDI